MGQVLHGSARTTEAVRRTIQHSHGPTLVARLYSSRRFVPNSRLFRFCYDTLFQLS